MSRFNALPPNGDSRKMTEQRSRKAIRPATPDKKGSWQFSGNQQPFARHGEIPSADVSNAENVWIEVQAARISEFDAARFITTTAYWEQEPKH